MNEFVLQMQEGEEVGQVEEEEEKLKGYLQGFGHGGNDDNQLLVLYELGMQQDDGPIRMEVLKTLGFRVAMAANLDFFLQPTCLALLHAEASFSQPCKPFLHA